MTLLSLSPCAGAAISTAPAAKRCRLAGAASPSARRLVPVEAVPQLLTLMPEPMAVAVHTFFTSAERPGWMLDFSRSENSGLIAVIL